MQPLLSCFRSRVFFLISKISLSGSSSFFCWRPNEQKKFFIVVDPSKDRAHVHLVVVFGFEMSTLLFKTFFIGLTIWMSYLDTNSSFFSSSKLFSSVYNHCNKVILFNERENCLHLLLTINALIAHFDKFAIRIINVERL